ncbi:hypothetical protein [Nonomuraea sp. NPDC050310]|uniref:hypothetical protein n=1 Tax=Nonomuraea sp. NPDC050310 TaxID=3154935 RepID=UPI0033E06B60
MDRLNWTRISAGLFRRLPPADQQAILGSPAFQALPYDERLAFLDAAAELGALDERDRRAAHRHTTDRGGQR